MYQTPIPPVQEERSLGDLFSELSAELQLLVRQEIALAKSEMSEKLSHLGKDVAYIAAGATVGFVAFQVFVALLIIALAYVMPWWLSALIVGVVLASLAYWAIRKGMKDIKERGIVPDTTIKTLEEDKEWLSRVA